MNTRATIPGHSEKDGIPPNHIQYFMFMCIISEHQSTNLEIIITVSLFFITYLKRSHCLINTAANGKIVYGGVLNHPFLVNDEETS